MVNISLAEEDYIIMLLNYTSLPLLKVPTQDHANIVSLEHEEIVYLIHFLFLNMITFSLDLLLLGFFYTSNLGIHVMVHFSHLSTLHGQHLGLYLQTFPPNSFIATILFTSNNL